MVTLTGVGGVGCIQLTHSDHVVSYPPDASPGVWQRYPAIIFDGLRPEGSQPPPQPPPSSLFV